MIYGYRLHLLITVGGVILDFELTPANADDRQAAIDLLTDYHELTVIGDKAYINATLAAMLWEQHRIQLITLPRRNQHQSLSPETRQLIIYIRQIIETMNGQLTEQLHIETNHARSFWGLCARLCNKLTAHTQCIYLNRLLGNPNFLQIKSLAFPN